jgi:hypothetical protein
MALVRISKNLIADVRKRVDDVAARTFETAVAPKNPVTKTDNLDVLFDASERAIWKEHLHLKSIVPPGWLVKKDRIDLKIMKGGTQLYPEMQVNRVVICPPNTPGYSYVDVRLDVSQIPQALSDEIDAYNTECMEHNTKFGKVREQILAYLNSRKSLNDALKAYPDLALYVPKHYIETVNRKTDRAAAQAKEQVTGEVTIDRDLITSTGVVGALHGVQDGQT